MDTPIGMHPSINVEFQSQSRRKTTERAVKQYKTDRSPKELPFKANRRALVHFALDSETAEMCTWLANGKSYFLLFNRGNGNNGAGNPLTASSRRAPTRSARTRTSCRRRAPTPWETFEPSSAM